MRSDGLTTLDRFVTALFEHGGALAEPLEPGVLQVLGGGGAGWPPEGELARLVFDPEALPDYPDGVPVFFGTPRADECLERGRALAPVARAFRADLPLSVHDPAGRVRRALSAPDLAIESDPFRARYDTLALFLFRVMFVGEEREEELWAAGVDMAMGRSYRGLDTWWTPPEPGESGRPPLLVNQRPHPIPDGPLRPLPEGMALAWREVWPRVYSGRRIREEDARTRIGVELARLWDYFDENLRDLDARRAKAPPGETAEWDGRRRATTAERDRRAAELELKKTIGVEAALASVLLVATPRLAGSFRLSVKGLATAPVEVLYDIAGEAILPPDCPACRKPTLEWRLSSPPPGAPGREALAVCPACGARDAETRARRR